MTRLIEEEDCPMTTANRAYSTFEIKDISDDDEEVRTIRGIASTPTPDRAADVVLPEGAVFKLPLPLLWQHNANNPIGHVTEAKITKKGIEIVATVAKDVTEDIEKAWKLIKAGLVRGLSIGFRGIDTEQIPNSWGVVFEKWEWLELSAVTIPANAEASITSVKKFDVGIKSDEDTQASASLPGVTGTKEKRKGHSAVKLLEKKNMTKSYADQIAAFEATRVAKQAELEGILDASGTAGETLDAAQDELFETLTDEIKSLDKHINRLKSVESTVSAKATPVNGDNARGASDARAAIVIRNEPKLEKGIEFARFAMAMGQAKGNIPQAYEIAKGKFGENNDVVTSLKAAVSAGTTTDPTWAAPLVDTYQRFAGDFVEFLRPQTILGKFGNGGVPSLRRVPFNISVPTQTSGGDGYWVGEGAPKPLTKFDFADINLRWAKVASIAVITEELLRFSNPAAETIVRDQLAQAIIARLDVDFVNPAKAAVTNVSPASITNGVTPIASSGTDIDAIRADIKALFSAYIAANVNPTTAVWIMPAMIALSLSLMTNPLGQSEFPGITMNGGTFNGMPVIVSEYTPAGTVILVNASDVYLADDGQVTIDASREASLQMDTEPTNNSGVPTATSSVSMFQTNSVAIRAERYINWQKRRASAVAMLTGVAWGGGPTT